MTKHVTIRAAVSSDIPALATLHVETWNATYPGFLSPPTYAVRERQWREAFAKDDGTWFCYVATDEDGRMVGFAKGQAYNHPDLPEFSGELNKLYVLKDFQREGVGKRLVGHVARRLLNKGIGSMVLFSEPDNPSGLFFENLGAEWIYSNDGQFHGTYGWRDLGPLVAVCQVEGIPPVCIPLAPGRLQMRREPVRIRPPNKSFEPRGSTHSMARTLRASPSALSPQTRTSTSDEEKPG